MKRLTSKSVPQPCDVAGAAVQKREKKIEGHDTKNTPRENKAVTQTPYAMEGENETSHDHHQIFDMLTFCQGSKHNLLHDHVTVLLLNTLSYIIIYYIIMVPGQLKFPGNQNQAIRHNMT